MEQMTEETLYWLFSTIAQTYGAIVGVMGMLSIYRLQSLSRYIQASRKRTEVAATPYLDVFGDFGLPSEDFVEQWQKLTEEKRKVLKKSFAYWVETMDREVPRIKRYSTQRTNIIRQFKRFIGVHLFIILGSIFGILFISAALAIKYLIPYPLVAALGYSAILIVSLSSALIGD